MRATNSGQGRLASMAHAAMPEMYFRVALWLSRHPTATTRQVMAHFDVSRSTAWRWREHFKAATGVA